MQRKTSKIQNASIDINDDGGRFITRIMIPADPLMFQIVKEIIGGKEYRRFPPSFCEPMVVVDIGANVGAASIMFKIRYPQASIYAFEPSASTFAYLQHNVKDFKGITALPFGLYHKDSQVPLYNGHRSSVENSLFPNEATAVNLEQAQLRRASNEFVRLGIDRISILKIDTEGAEVPILYDIRDWLDKTELIFVEYHAEEDRLEIDRMVSHRFVLADFTFASTHRGMMTYLSKSASERIPGFHQLRISRH